jgi:CII-binding regulator of phage lambda lysogenization HflD
MLGDEFRARARAYLINGLERGVPSLFVDVKGVYSDPSRMSVVGEIFEEVISSLEKEISLHGNGTPSQHAAC